MYILPRGIESIFCLQHRLFTIYTEHMPKILTWEAGIVV